MKKCVFLISLLLITFYASAQVPVNRVPATPFPIDVVQPNGDTLTIRLIGDERFHFTTTIDGYLIRRNEKDWYCYAHYTKKGEIVVSCRKAHNEDKRSRREKRYLLKNIPNRFEDEDRL